MKTKIKDLKSKISDRTPPRGTSREAAASMACTTSTVFHHASAPNSPVFSKRPQTELFTISSSSHHRKASQATLQTSNSMLNNTNLTNHTNNNSNSSHSGSGSLGGSQLLRISSKSPTNTSPSPCSSLSSSEMNILQELQQHALFKLPAVDRSVSVPRHSFTFSNLYLTLHTTKSEKRMRTKSRRNASKEIETKRTSAACICFVA